MFKFPVGPRTGNLTPEERTRKNLTYENAVDIRERCKSVEDVSAMLFANGMVNVHYKGNDMYDVNLIGVEEAYARGGQVDMHLGRFFTDEESRRRMPVAVVGQDIEKGLLRQRRSRSARPSWWTATNSQVIGTMLRPAASFFGDTDNARAAALRHDAEDVPERARERHRGDRRSTASCRRRWTKCAPCCASTGACPTTSPTTSRSPRPNRWWPISARSPP